MSAGFKAPKQNASGRSVEQIVAEAIEQAEEYLSQAEVERAIKVLQKAMKSAPNDTKLLDLLAQAHVENGDERAATPLLLRSVQLAPNDNPEKYLNLGQLSSGKRAAEYYQRGIALLMERCQPSSVNVTPESITEALSANNHWMNAPVEEMCDEAAQLRRQIASALCSVAELYQTDLCEDPEAEQICNQVLSQAIVICPYSPESFFALANLRFLQEDDEATSAALDQALRLIRRHIFLVKSSALMSVMSSATSSSAEMDDGMDGLDELGDRLVESHALWPDYELRVSCGKLLLELGRNDDAARLFSELVDEDDGFVESLHLAAVAHFHCHHWTAANDKCAQALKVS